MAKRQRKYRLEVEDVDGNIRKIYDPFTLDFDIEKGIMSNVCQASFTVYNLGEQTRNAIYKDLLDTTWDKRRTVTFYAGYSEDGELSRVFKGTICQCYHYRSGVDFMTVIEADSGSDYLASSYVNISIPEGTSTNDAVFSVLQGVTPDGGARYIGNFEGTFKRATSWAGNVASLIKQYTDGNFFIDDGDIFCIKDFEVIDGVFNKINADSGLLGSPQREEHYITFEMLFEPRILMGQWIDLESVTNKFLNGRFKVVGFHHVGTISDTVCRTAKSTVRVWSAALLNNIVRKK